MPSDRAEAAAMLGRVVAAVNDGTLRADSDEAKRLLRRIEGAVAALEVVAAAETKAARSDDKGS